MRALVAVLVVTLAFAGCADGPEPAPPAPVVAPTLPLAFAEAIRMEQFAGAGEPNIAVLPDGTLFVTAPVGGSPKPNVVEGAAYLWRSTDGGTSWEVLRSPDLPMTPENGPRPGGAFCSCDADVATSPDGWVYYSDWWIAGLEGGNYLVEASGDGGQTWSANPVPIPQNLLSGMDRQWLVAGEDGFVGLFYSFFTATPLNTVVGTPVPVFGIDRSGRAIEAVFSTDHGASWTDPIVVAPTDAGTSYQIAHPRMLPDGTLWMPYGAVPASDDTFWRADSEVRIAVSNDQGRTWEHRKVADAPEGFDNLWAVQGATDPDTGRSYVVWAARLNDQHSILWLSSSWDLVDWTVPYPVDGSGINVLPWADARAGRIVVGWYGTGATGDPIEVPAEAQWFALAAEWNATEPGASRPNATTMPISYVSLEPVKTGPMCPRGAACAGDRELLDYVSMVYAPDGRIHYAFARSEGGEAFVHVAQQTGYAAQEWPDG